MDCLNCWIHEGRSLALDRMIHPAATSKKCSPHNTSFGFSTWYWVVFADWPTTTTTPRQAHEYKTPFFSDINVASETTLKALPKIFIQNRRYLFLIIMLRFASRSERTQKAGYSFLYHTPSWGVFILFFPKRRGEPRQL